MGTRSDAPLFGLLRSTGASSGGRIVLHLHDGAFEVGSRSDYQAFCSRLAVRLGATVVAVDCRLAPALCVNLM
jgi:acetyl esterase/lipase